MGERERRPNCEKVLAETRFCRQLQPSDTADQLGAEYVVHIAPGGIKSRKQASPYISDQPREEEGNTVSIRCSSATSRAPLILFPVPIPTT